MRLWERCTRLPTCQLEPLALVSGERQGERPEGRQQPGTRNDGDGGRSPTGDRSSPSGKREIQARGQAGERV